MQTQITKIVFILAFSLPCLYASGQSNLPQDSIVYYLNQYADGTIDDSSLLKKILTRPESFDPSLLIKESYQTAMGRIKANIPIDKYFYLFHYFMGNACYASSNDTEYDYAIDYGVTFIDAFKKLNRNQFQNFTFLEGLRDLRVPYRNSPRIYEGIELYSNLAPFFQEKKDSAALSITYNVLASFYNTIGLLDKAVYFQLKSIDYLDDNIYPIDTSIFGYGAPPNIGLLGKINRKSVLGKYLTDFGRYTEALNQLNQITPLLKNDELDVRMTESSFRYLQLARAHIGLASDSANYYLDLMRKEIKHRTEIFVYAHYYMEKANGFYTTGNLDSAEANILKCKQIIVDHNLRLTNIMGALTPEYYHALILVKQNRIKPAISGLNSEISILRELNLRNESLTEIKLLAELYKLDKDFSNATNTYEEFNILKNEVIEEERKNRTISFEIEKRIAENEKAVQLLESQNQYNKKKQYYLLGILALTALLALGLITRNRYRQKVHQKLIQKNSEIESAINKLQATQSQLIQSEKMASLGELTAGIAHEIQNPLNFVNNFSEINTELIDELNEAAAHGNLDEVIALAKNIKENEEKTVHHGKRADAIVKSMLQHSRSGSDEKESTDINALADEYLRLAYHGLRAKNKSFNAKLETDFDLSIGSINVIQQDMGRVILNLITNAFHAVVDKQQLGIPNYEACVSVKTRNIKTEGNYSIMEIAVSDNGNGIPPTVMNKIFQPFFTTKPTGQGTGLGLSMAYDIVKSHGGELTVDTKEGEGTTFIISIPA